ncbi:MAG: LD-carboxypeptidase [Bacteroidota bacterium]
MPLPPPLRPDSRIALVAPASPPRSPDHLEAGVAALEARGLTVEVPHLAPTGYLAASDEERAAALNALLARDDLDALVCVRGGYGVLRLLDRLDYAVARRHPKLIVGYSDITALHLALFAHAGLPGLSGPMAAPDWPRLAESDAGRAAEAQFWALAGGTVPVDIVGPGSEPLVPMQPGDTTGTLLGGNLSLVAALLGTPYLPDLTGAILFVEDIGEAPYRIDGLLARLRLAGLLDQLGGLVFGAFTSTTPPSGQPASFTVDEVLEHYAASLAIPVARGLVYGHFPVKSTLPVGVRARLTVTGTTASLTVLDPVVAGSQVAAGS